MVTAFLPIRGYSSEVIKVKEETITLRNCGGNPILVTVEWEGWPVGALGMEVGERCCCANCGTAGRWDKMVEDTARFNDAVFFNPFEESVQCYQCWLK